MTFEEDGPRPRLSIEEHVRLCFNRELRHIEASKLTKLSAIIDESKDYDKLLEKLTTRPDLRPHNGLNLSTDAIQLIKQQIYCGKSPTMALLNHWSITGRRRPTVRTLLDYLRSCNMKRAEEYVLREILGLKLEPAVQYHIEHHRRLLPIQMPNTTEEPIVVDDIYKFSDLDDLAEKLPHQCQRYSFDLIYRSTDRFCYKPYDFRTKLGTKIGEGRFSSVYRASTRLLVDEGIGGSESEQTVAAKLLKSECNKDYLLNEINLIRRVDHENVLKFLGLALGDSDQRQPAYICLIYPYMENGSLLDCLRDGLPAREFSNLSWSERMMIARKVARGISYLHNFEDGPIIHRDIKTANILLDASLEPKLGDFTIVRQVEGTAERCETQFTQNIIGTSVYMPPEAFMGKISTKFDSFSFGVVLLELLTGMRPFNEEQDEDILTYINERLSDLEDLMGSNSTIKEPAAQARDELLAEIIDKRAGLIERTAEPKMIFGLAQRATESKKNARPAIDEILAQLEQVA